MKDIEEIKRTPGIVIKREGPDGFGGSVFPIEYKNGKVKVEIRNIDYSREELKNKIKQVGGTYPEAKVWQNLCYQTLTHTEDVRREFCHMAKDMMIEKYNGELPQGFDAHFVSFDDDIYKEVSKKFEKYFIL